MLENVAVFFSTKRGKNSRFSTLYSVGEGSYLSEISGAAQFLSSFYCPKKNYTMPESSHNILTSNERVITPELQLNLAFSNLQVRETKIGSKSRIF